MASSKCFRYLDRILRGVEIHNPTILEASLQPMASKFKEENKTVYIFEYNSVFAAQTSAFNKIFEPKVHYLSINNTIVEKHINERFSLQNITRGKPWSMDNVINHRIFEFEKEWPFNKLKNPVVICGSLEKTPARNFAFLRGWIFGYFFNTTNIINNQMKSLHLTDEAKVNEITAKEQKIFEQNYSVTHNKFDDKVLTLYKHEMEENHQFLEILDLTYNESLNRKKVTQATNKQHKSQSLLFPTRILSALALSTIGVEFYSLARNINTPTQLNHKQFELMYNTNKLVIVHADTALRVLSKKYKDMSTDTEFSAFDFRSKLSFRMQMIYDIEPLTFISPKNPNNYTLFKRIKSIGKDATTEDFRKGNVVGAYSYESILSYLKKAYPEMRAIERVEKTDVTFKNYELDGPAVIMNLKPSEYLTKNFDKIDFIKLRRVLSSIVYNPKRSILYNLNFLSTENVIKEIKERVDLEYYENTTAIDMDKDKFFELYELFDEISSKWNLAYDDLEIVESDMDFE